MNLPSQLEKAWQARQDGNFDLAAGLCAAHLELKPDDPAGLWLMGVIRYEQGNLAESEKFSRLALRLKPGFHEARYNLGLCLLKQGKLGQAEAELRQALAYKPDCPDSLHNLGCVYLQQGRTKQAASCLRRALKFAPASALIRSTLCHCLAYVPGVSPLEILTESLAFAECLPAPGPRPLSLDATPDKNIKIGFVSADLRRHPVGYFCLPLFENLDPGKFAIICYSDSKPDQLSEKLKAKAWLWRETGSLSDSELAQLIRQDAPDMLIDLAGHSEGNRLAVFSQRLAPLQLTWAGYPGTTGLAAMNYLISDRFETPPGSEAYYREKPLILDGPYVAYAPPEAPRPNSLPALRSGRISFGCFNNLAKLNPEVLKLWTEILDQLPGSRLILTTAALGDPETASFWAKEASKLGLGQDRLILNGPKPHFELLASYGEIDIALDPFPYCGGLSTLEALYMGVPVLSLAGEGFAARHGASHLSQAGLGELVCASRQDYLEKAISLAKDLPYLQAMRLSLRERLLASPICDGPRFAASFGAALRKAWLDYLSASKS